MAQVIRSDGYQLFTGTPDIAKNTKQSKGGGMQVSSEVRTASGPSDDTGALRKKAEELEAAFLAEMLAHAGFGAARESFGGGIGEDQFASFLRSEQAKALAAKGGIGLAEHFFQSMTANRHA
jgi:peptidoglycan hydrolase FlgJ